MNFKELVLENPFGLNGVQVGRPISFPSIVQWPAIYQAAGRQVPRWYHRLAADRIAIGKTNNISARLTHYRNSRISFLRLIFTNLILPLLLRVSRFLRPGKHARNYRYEHNGKIYHEDVESDRGPYCFLPYEEHVRFIACHSKQTESREYKSPPATIPNETSRDN